MPQPTMSCAENCVQAQSMICAFYELAAIQEHVRKAGPR